MKLRRTYCCSCCCVRAEGGWFRLPPGWDWGYLGAESYQKRYFCNVCAAPPKKPPLACEHRAVLGAGEAK